MTLRAAVLCLVSLVPAAYASGKAPPKVCTSDASCASGESCATTTAGKRCVHLCDGARPSSCPAEQRCVKDGKAFVCRPINDGVDL
jgi:hypothetical protein